MDPSKFRVLLVDDEPDILEFLRYNLTREGYVVYITTNSREALEIAKTVLPHLILLDVMMPEMDGMETCSELRKIPELHKTIIAFLTARAEDYSQIVGFEAGADDYITKPVKPKVLQSRITALLKRHRFSLEPGVHELGNEPLITLDGEHSLVIDRERYLVIKDKQDMSLPRKEFELLSLLSSKPNKVFTRDDIFRAVWGDDIIVGDRTIDVHIRKLREKLGERYIKTIKGVGYKFVD